MTPTQLSTSDSPAGSPRPAPSIAWTILKPLASLRLTVVLLLLAIALVFLGTLAQKTSGMWTVVDKYFWSWIVLIDLQPLLEFGKIFFGLPKDWHAPSWVQFPFPAGKLIGGLMFINLLAAHAVRFKLTWKRTGIWMAHGGLLLLFVGEAITRECQVEQRMTVPEGEAVNFTEDARFPELAFTTPDTDGTERMTVISGIRLERAARTHELISHPDLPVDIRVDQYMRNSAQLKPQHIAARKAAGRPVPENPATAGLGLEDVVEPKPEVAGIDNQIDVPSAYVTLYRKGTDQTIGTYLVSLWYTADPFDRESEQKQSVKVDGVDYNLALRYTRYYKPFSFYLKPGGFHFDRYTGTEEAKNYSSDLILIDPERGQRRDVHIQMNMPLRYRGETFYQQNFDRSTEKTTVLQVVRNPGWFLPYVACGLVGLGLLLHFVMGLTQYLRRQTSNTASASPLEIGFLILAATTILSLLLRFGLLAHWFDEILGPVGSGSLLAEIGSFWVMTALPVSLGLTLLIYRLHRPAPPVVASTGPTPSVLERFLPVGVVALGALMLLGAAMSKPSTSKMNLSQMARLPVVDSGRVKPLDTVARVYLRKISAREEFVGADGQMHPAIEWLMDTMAVTSTGLKHNVIRIENDQVISLLGLERREGLRYSLTEVLPKYNDLREAAQRADEELHPREGMKSKSGGNTRVDKFFESSERDVFAQQVAEVFERVQLYRNLAGMGIPLTLPPTASEKWRSLGELQNRATIDAIFAWLAQNGSLPPRYRNLSEAQRRKLPSEEVALLSQFLLQSVPEEQQKQFLEDFQDRVEALVRTDADAVRFENLIDSYRAGNQEQFSAALAEFEKATESGIDPTERAKGQFEVFLNEFAPAYYVIYLYVIAGLLTLGGWIAIGFRPPLAEALRKSAFWMLVFAFVAHAFALASRMYLMDRPLVFVTNLYSTAVFIGWAAVGLGLFVERIAPFGLGNLAAAIVGGATAILAHNLATSGDTLTMMEAVLDTNFWLATHVTTINLGYAATYVAGAFGVLYIVLGLFTNALRRPETVGVGPLAVRGPDVGKVLGQIIYGVVCLATLLSFVGTVLGGIWADDSWGRFWGWDPKENGAVLIVLWNALILHARWCGLVKDRGVAVLTLVGNMVTTWSYFGTNQLGVGLHAYGFNNALATGCMITWMLHLVLIGVGLVPLVYWRSFSSTAMPRAEALAGFGAMLPPATSSVNGHAANGSPKHGDRGRKHGKKR